MSERGQRLDKRRTSWVVLRQTVPGVRETVADYMARCDWESIGRGTP